ncbi:MAG: hypothetical protein ACXWNQ_07720 [Anaerolineales bacterium]
MQKKLVFLILAGLLISGCQLRRANRLLGSGSNATLTVATSTETQAPTEPPTRTPPPPPTVTTTPAPDAAAVGLPAEPAGTTPLDFAADACKAQWSNGSDTVPCKGSDPSTTSGYVIELRGDLQGFPSNIPMLLMYPPRINGDTLLGTYPSFVVQKGDRFRAVLTCRAHNFCDVEFGLAYYTSNGPSGLANWSYLFTDPPRAVDYSLDGIAGQTVQFALRVRRHAEGLQAYALWIFPHIYRPAP